MHQTGLGHLLETDGRAYEFFQTLPIFVQDAVREHADQIRTKAELSAYANQAISDGLSKQPYRNMFEDSTNSDIDLQ